MRIIDSHVHVVQNIAGFGDKGELRSLGRGDGMARYASGEVLRMIPEQFHGDQVTPEQLIETMDENGVEKAVLLQGNFYGFQNLYSWDAVQKYPDRLTAAASYDPFCAQRDAVRKHLFEELGFRIEKWELSTGSGLMANHPGLKLDGEDMMEAFAYGAAHGHVMVIDVGKCGSPSWQIPEMKNVVSRFPDTKFVFCHLLAPNAFQEEALIDALKCLKADNVWFDIASVVHNVLMGEAPYTRADHYLRLAADIVGADKLIFGTDFPSCLKEDPYAQFVRNITDSKRFNDAEKAMILAENAEKVFFG